MATTTFTARGHKVRTQSHFRYQIVGVTAEKAEIYGRTDNFATAMKRASTDYDRRDGRAIVVIDRTTGEEVGVGYDRLTPATPESLGLPSDEEVIAEVTAQVTGKPLPTTEVERVQAEIESLRGRVEQARIRLEEAEDESHEIGMRWIRADDAGKDTTELKEEDTKAEIKKNQARHAYDSLTARFAQAQRKLDDLRDPDKVAARAARNERLNTLKKERNAMAGKSTAKEQGVPSVYLSNNGEGPNYFPGGDAANKGDMFNAILHVELGVPVKKDARYDFTTPDGLKLAKAIIKARNWEPNLEKSRQAAIARLAAADRKAKDAEAKKAETAKAKTEAKAAKAEASTGDEVTPDPKPEAKPRRRRGVKATA